ncbi:MAG: epoxyqueuosine reductase [Candidatus Lokiarchaeota archaeon]|nr:epoxyqueuosine reductase [Candidatus Lokiarchaeota archaeon]
MSKKTAEIKDYFLKYLDKINYKGFFGVANFYSVYNHLIDEQQEKLKKILQDQFNEFEEKGTIISLGICYDLKIIDYINQINESVIDKERWDMYGSEYKHINRLLKDISSEIALKFNGIAIPPTTETPSHEINNFTDYFLKTISHRLVAEFAGIGWRGKNELLITEKYGPALRLTSILMNMPLIQGEKMRRKCGDCRACLDVCKFLNNKHNLKDYRENCRKYILSLCLNSNVCGKCIKACINNRICKNTFINSPNSKII